MKERLLDELAILFRALFEEVPLILMIMLILFYHFVGISSVIGLLIGAYIGAWLRWRKKFYENH